MLMFFWLNPGGEPPPDPPTPASAARGGLIMNVGALMTR